jgi:hypothetical protein
VPRRSPGARCALTAPFHPCHARLAAPFGGLFSVALSCGSPRPVVNRHPALWCSDFPRRPPFLQGRRVRPSGSGVMRVTREVGGGNGRTPRRWGGGAARSARPGANHAQRGPFGPERHGSGREASRARGAGREGAHERPAHPRGERALRHRDRLARRASARQHGVLLLLPRARALLPLSPELAALQGTCRSGRPRRSRCSPRPSAGAGAIEACSSSARAGW